MTLRFIKPVVIGDAQLASSDVPETDHATWSVGTTYAAGDRVIKTATHKIYESVQAGNIGHDPAADTTGVWWVPIGMTNRWRMFDESVGSAAEQASSIDVTLYPQRAEGLALLDIAGAQVQVTVVDGATTVYDRTFSIGDGSILADWWEYFFTDPSPKTALVVDDLPGYPGASVRVRITGGTCRCGTLALGPVVEVGGVRVGARVGIIDYSRKETDEFGVTSVVQRSYAKRMDLTAQVAAGRLDYLVQQLSEQRARPAVWIADDDIAALVIYGWAKDWAAVLPGRILHEYSITIEGLV